MSASPDTPLIEEEEGRRTFYSNTQQVVVEREDYVSQRLVLTAGSLSHICVFSNKNWETVACQAMHWKKKKKKNGLETIYTHKLLVKFTVKLQIMTLWIKHE